MIYSVLFADIICVLLYVDAQTEVDNVAVVKEPGKESETSFFNLFDFRLHL